MGTTMHDNLSVIVNELKEDRRLPLFDEAKIKQAVIECLLHGLGWDIFNSDEVQREYSIANKKIDFALRINNTNKVFIMVARIGANLKAHQGQLLNFASQQAVPLAILTNGITWWFYLPLHDVDREQSKFYTIELVQQDTNDIIDGFINFLSRPNVHNNSAIQNAKDLHEKQQRAFIIQQTLPKAWNKIMSEPNKRLIEIIIDEVEVLSGIKTEMELVKQFLLENQKQMIIDADVGAYDESAVDPEIDANLDEKQQVRFEHQEEKHEKLPIVHLQPAPDNRKLREQCIERIGRYFKDSVIKVNQTIFRLENKDVGGFCLISRLNLDKEHYWFTVNENQLNHLKAAINASAIFYCVNSDTTFIFPLADFKNWILGNNPVIRMQKKHWHVYILLQNGRWVLHQNNRNDIDIGKYII